MSVTYQCGDIYDDPHLGLTFYCTQPRGHDLCHVGRTAGDYEDWLWGDGDPNRRANKDSLPPSG